MRNEIKSKDLVNLLKPYGIKIAGGPVDKTYKLLTLESAIAFLKYYHDTNSYSLDEYDCDDFAWIMRAEFLKRHPGYAWGYIEASGKLPIGFQFPNHAFNFVVTVDHKVWYCDELNVVAAIDTLVPAFKVKCNMAKI